MKPLVVRHEVPRAVLRIIPHQSVLNSTSRKLYATLFELFSVKHDKFPWQHRQGMHIALRPAPNFWWIVRMYSTPGDEEDKKHIEFYVSMPTDYVDAFRTKFRNHEQWKRCTIESVPTEGFTFPDDENTDLYKLKYKRHDMFSLDFDYTQHMTPIRDVLNVSNELKGRESVDIFVQCESMERAKWKKLADFAWEQWDKGGMAHRAGVDPVRMVRNIGGFVNSIFFEFKSLMHDTVIAIERSFFHKGNAPESKREKPQVVKCEREELLINGKLSERTNKKRNMPVFKTSIRYAVHSSDEVRRGMLARSVAVAYDDLAGDNRLVSVKVNIRAKEELNDLRNWRIIDKDPNLMSVEEIGKLQQLPTADVQSDFAESLESNRRIEVDIPKCFLDPSGIYVGTSTVRGITHDIHIPYNPKNPDTLMTARAFMGSPRQGKDQAIINFIVESKRKHGIGAVIPDWIDEHGVDEHGNQRGLADAVRDALSPEDVIDINWGDFDWPVYFGLDGITTKANNNRIAFDRVSKEITNFLMGGDIDHHTTREYLRDAAKVCGGDWLNIKRLFNDAEYRAEKIDEMERTNIGDADMWRVFSDDMSDAQRAQIYAPINVRMGEILNDEILKPIFCQQHNPKVELQKWIAEGKVVILRIPTGEMSELSAKIMAYFVIMTVFLIKLSMGGKGAPTWLVLNEPHQIQTPGLVHFVKRVLSEGPKYRLAPIFAFHHLGQLSKDFADTLVSSSLSWHLFYNSNLRMYETLKAHIEPTFTPEDAMKQTARFHFIAAGWRDTSGTTQEPFMCKAPRPVKDRWDSQDNSILTQQHSRIYGRPISEVLEDFKRRNKIARPKREEETPIVELVAPEPPTKKSPPPHVYHKKSRR